MPTTIVVPGTDRPPLALLVDRDADTRQTYAEFLRQLACETLQAEDGREALAHAIARHPDVIVTETRLPGIDGLDFCHLLRHDSATADIPIVFLTADSCDSSLRRARAVADAVLLKPCLPELLAVEIARVLNRSYDLRVRSTRAIANLGDHLTELDALLERSRRNVRRVALSRAHTRGETTTPPFAVPTTVCPSCDRPLTYSKSNIGGVSAKHIEQWDYFECVGCGGKFQYRQRTRRLRRV